MIELKDGSYVFDYSECHSDVDFINYSHKSNSFDKENPALRIYFNNNLEHNVKIFKDLIRFKDSGISFCSNFDGKDVRYIVSNYSNNDVLKAFEALYLGNNREQISFLYDAIYDQLDEIWSNINPCEFCDGVCIGIKHRQSPGNVDGCCYSFDYPKHPLFSLHFIENIQKCKYFDNKKRRCSIKNISCKLYVCDYVKKNSNFDIRLEDFLLVQTFFNKKQKLILRFNYFRPQEEIIDKLLAQNHIPYFIYYWFNYYRISKSKK